MAKKMSLYDLLSQAERSNDKENIDFAGLYNNYLLDKSSQLRKPISMQLELLPLCNFSCPFCFVKKTNEEIVNNGHSIMGFEEWKYYIDEAKSFGINKITLSGGECTLHPEFIKIYEYIYKKGFLISIITNGSNITDRIYSILEKYPPDRISVTLYGMSRETYKRTCGNANAFEKVISNCEKLINRGFEVTFNYTAGKDNFSDMDSILAYARKKKVSIFPTDALISSENCHGSMLGKELVDHKKYKELEFLHYSIVKNRPYEDYINAYFNTYSKPIWHEKNGTYCSAGKSMAFINWLGMMIPCVNFSVFQVDPRKVGFEESWNQISQWCDGVPLLTECEGCIFIDKCHRCPAFHYADMGEFGKVSPRLCFKNIYPKEAAKLQAEYDRRQAEKD